MTETTKFALRLAYRGTRYCGWQKQSKDPLRATPRPCIQEVVEAALSKIYDQPMRLIASGRTDSGVHALGQVAHFRIPKPGLTEMKLLNGLNSILPEDIRVMKVWAVDEDFHAQRSAIKKQYSYYFQQGPCVLPPWMETSWWIRKTLDVDAMNVAAKRLIGENEFRVFQASGSNPMKSTVRTIFEAEVARLPMPHFPGQDLNENHFNIVRFRVVGSGFLKQMVRSIAGTLLQIGENQRPESDMEVILKAQDRTQIGATAPAKGLTLERVWYNLGAYGNSD